MAIVTTKKGPRHYFDTEHPETRYPGVTTIVGMLPKPFLQRWNANMAADRALDSLDFVKQMADVDRKGAKSFIAGAAYAHTKKRGDIGSEAHIIFEKMIRGQSVGPRVGPGMQVYRDGFAEFLDRVQPELVRAEDVMWSDTHQYAGSFDAILRVRLGENGKPDPAGEPAVVMTDWKTSRSTYPEVALQMSAYANADKIIAPDGTESPLPTFDGAAVLHITDAASPVPTWEFTPVVISDVIVGGTTYNVFDHFLHLRETFRWEQVVQKYVLGDHIAESDSGTLTGTERRAS